VFNSHLKTHLFAVSYINLTIAAVAPLTRARRSCSDFCRIMAPINFIRPIIVIIIIIIVNRLYRFTYILTMHFDTATSTPALYTKVYETSFRLDSLHGQCDVMSV